MAITRIAPCAPKVLAFIVTEYRIVSLLVVPVIFIEAPLEEINKAIGGKLAVGTVPVLMAEAFRLTSPDALPVDVSARLLIVCKAFCTVVSLVDKTELNDVVSVKTLSANMFVLGGVPVPPDIIADPILTGVAANLHLPLLLYVFFVSHVS